MFGRSGMWRFRDAGGDEGDWNYEFTDYFKLDESELINSILTAYETQ